MNKKLKLTVGIAALVGIIVLAGVGYNYLTKDYEGQETVPEQQYEGQETAPMQQEEGQESTQTPQSGGQQSTQTQQSGQQSTTPQQGGGQQGTQTQQSGGQQPQQSTPPQQGGGQVTTPPQQDKVEQSTPPVQNEEPVKKASNFTVLNKGGGKVNLSDYFGKPIIVNFWATWCGPCKSEMPAFNKIYKEYGDKINFMMVNLTDGYRDTVKKVDKYIAENGYSFPVYYDTEFSAADVYRVNSVPMTLFITAKGEILDSRLGAMNEKEIRRYIERLIGGK